MTLLNCILIASLSFCFGFVVAFLISAIAVSDWHSKKQCSLGR